MMEEMKSKLARRKQSSDVDQVQVTRSPGRTEPTTPTTTPTTPSSSRSQSQIIADTFSPRVSTSALNKLESYNGSASGGKHNLEALKTEILEEIRSEMEKSKMEIIDIIREEIKSLKSNQ